ncbi:MAG: response regulator [Pirellulales bacterium]|nr:response regulator [Pirellulales bacterium]
MATILLADDCKNIREYCRREFEEEGYRVVVARDGGEALRMMSHAEPDLVILDIFMPGLNGLETISRIHTVHPDLAVIFFTSFDDACVRDKRSEFAAACVEKRGDLSELKKVVASVLRSKRQGQSYHRLGLPTRTTLGATV